MGGVRRQRLTSAIATPVVAAALATGCLPTYGEKDLPARSGVTVPGRAFTATVDRVVDGDTFLARRAGERLRVRLIGIDAPESARPGYPVECWGTQSSALLTRLLPAGSRVRAAYEPGGRQDRYGRELWDVWLPDGRFLQGVLVRRGAVEAVAYGPQLEHAAVLADLEAMARRDDRGLFGACPG